MNTKSPISILQEYAVQRKICMPDYTWELPQTIGASFKCTVKIGNQTAIGYGTNKQNAKTECALKALEKFGIKFESNDSNNNQNNKIPQLGSYLLKQPVIAVNYVGALNEVASINKLAYPEYTDHLTLVAPFKVTCYFVKWKTDGNGLTKKNAKQEAAKIMLEIVKHEKIVPIVGGNEVILSENKQKNVDELTEKVNEKLKELSLNSNNGFSRQIDDVIPQIVSDSPIKTFDDLRDVLSAKGYISKIETLQTRPWIQMLKLEGHSCIVMGHGSSKQEALDDLFQMTLILFIKGYNFKTYFDK